MSGSPTVLHTLQKLDGAKRKCRDDSVVISKYIIDIPFDMFVPGRIVKRRALLCGCYHVLET